MPSSWLKRRFNYIKRLSGFVSGSAKSVDESSSANLSKNIRNDLNSANRWAKEEKNAYRDYTNRDQRLNAAIETKKFIDEEKKCNVNVVDVRQVAESSDTESKELTGKDDVDGSELCIVVVCV